MKTETAIATIYVAEDGKKFEDRSECEAYEEELNRAASFNALKEKVDTIDCIECGEAPFGGYYVDDNRYEYRWYRPKTLEEVAALENFFHISFEQFVYVSEMIGEWVCIEIEGGYDDYTGTQDVYIVDELENSNESLVDFYAKLGYDVEIKKKPISVEARDKAIEHLWKRFEDIPMNPETECIEQPFFQFPIGSNRDEIWKWFDARYSKGVASLING